MAEVSSIHTLRIADQERKVRTQPLRAVRPRIASTIVLTCGDPKYPKILMGLRADRHDFVPSVYVFPGGGVDRADSYAPCLGNLSTRTKRILEAAYSSQKAQAVVLAAIRETREETGLMLGRVSDWKKNIRNDTWNEFRQARVTPDLSGIEVFGRAVTPPGRHRRYDTWFFIKHLGADTLPVSDSVELLNVGWFDLEEIDSLKTHRATDVMLAVLRNYLEYDILPPRIFYFRARHGTFRQDRFP
ncbi:MAG: NUDIX domain-containing protein [Hyphomonadaceae bacterium]|nr:NUDIX domain-containing protein [Hyphomonadaceae bacterium]